MKFNERMTPKQSIIFVIVIAIVVFIAMQVVRGQTDHDIITKEPKNLSDPQFNETDAKKMSMRFLLCSLDGGNLNMTTMICERNSK